MIKSQRFSERESLCYDRCSTSEETAVVEKMRIINELGETDRELFSSSQRLDCSGDTITYSTRRKQLKRRLEMAVSRRIRAVIRNDTTAISEKGLCKGQIRCTQNREIERERKGISQALKYAKIKARQYFLYS